MPLYDYRCAKCSAVVEELVPINAEGPKEHAGCGGELARVFGVPAVIYTGSGWAKRDRRPEQSKPKG